MENKIKDPMQGDKRFTKTYSKELVKHINSSVIPEELNLYQELYNAVKDANNLHKPQDLMMLDMAIFDYLRVKKVQKVLRDEGVTVTIMSRSGQPYTKSHEANYLLNSIETQFRNLMKEIGITGKEQFKQKLGVEAQDFSSYISSTVVDAEVVEDDKVPKQKKDNKK